jgi:hypothetical protein
MSKDAAERKREERSRMRDKGYVLRQIWVHPDDWKKVKDYVLRIMKVRDKS